MAWENEANNPVVWTTINFSPIVENGIGQHIVYVGGYPVHKFYKYNLDTNEWTELADPPADIFRAVSMSPDGTKLAAPGHPEGNLLFIYDIAGNSWSTSSAAPDLTIDGGATALIASNVWTDDDTIWCQVRGYLTSWRVKCYRYVVSTDTWTQFTNYITPAQSGGNCMSVNSAGTALFVGAIGANDYSGLKYIIATDAYSTFSIGSGWAFYGTIDRTAKLWYWDTLASYLGIIYYDCDAETASDIIFPYDPERDKPSWLTCGIYGTTHIIAHHRSAEPKNRSYRIITAPTETTQAVSGIKADSATGNGTITDNGGEDCDKRGFVYNTSSHGDPGNTAPADSEYADYVEETDSFGTGAFTLSLTSLEPKTPYYVRAYAHNSAGYSYGNEVSFTTLAAVPTVTTDPASNIEPTTVTLNGTLDYDGDEACDCGFEYGETTDYGTTTDTESKTTGETFSQGLLGLKSGIVYHFRAIATNSAGTSYGADRTFHTKALSAAAHQALGKSYPLGRAEI